MSRSVVLLSMLLLLPGKAVRAAEPLDVAAELRMPGVKLLVVEFYATWCKPCMDAVPRWKALHEKYASKGLRFVVVSAEGDRTCHKPPDWSPDRSLCDDDGGLQERFGVDSLPKSFLYSWEGKLSAWSRDPEPFEKSIGRYFGETHLKMAVGEVDVIGDKFAVGSNPDWLREYVISRVVQHSKFDVVSSSTARVAAPAAGACTTDFPPNSRLRIKVQGDDRGNRTLSLSLEKYDGCILAQAQYPYKGQGFKEDMDSMRQAADRAADDVLRKVVRVKRAEPVDVLPPPPPEEVVVRLESRPPGAKVYFNGVRLCGDKTTPCSAELAPGPATFDFRLDRYLPSSVKAEVKGGMGPVMASLEPNFAVISVSGTPAGAAVKVDGKEVGRVPLSGQQVDPGRHRVEVVDDRYYPQAEVVVLERGDKRDLKYDLKPVLSVLKVKARDEKGEPVAGKVFVDGREMGVTGKPFEVIVGEHEVLVKSESGEGKERVRIVKGEAAEIMVKLIRGNGDGVVYIPAGEFIMGTTDAEIEVACRHQKAEGYDCDRDWFKDEKPQRRVHVDAFYIDKHEVTAGEYKACVDAGGCTAADTGGGCTYGASGKESHPINCVDWNQAKAYCERAGKRLPTEAEWEKAARGTDGRLYPWGNSAPSCDRVVWGDGKRADGCGKVSTWPVCSKTDGNSPYGICDMAGNVWEWVSDWYDGDYYKGAPGRNPEGPSSGEYRVLRGGSWYLVTPNPIRAANRRRNSPASRSATTGSGVGRRVSDSL